MHEAITFGVVFSVLYIVLIKHQQSTSANQSYQVYKFKPSAVQLHG